MSDKEAIISKVQYLTGRHVRKCGGHKREGGCALPGEVCHLVPYGTSGVVRHCDVMAEVSRGHSRSLDRTEGLNM